MKFDKKIKRLYTQYVIWKFKFLMLFWSKSRKYSQSWANDHLSMTTTILRSHLNNDSLSTTATIFEYQWWSLYTGLTLFEWLTISHDK